MLASSSRTTLPSVQILSRRTVLHNARPPRRPILQPPHAPKVPLPTSGTSQPHPPKLSPSTPSSSTSASPFNVAGPRFTPLDGTNLTLHHSPPASAPTYTSGSVPPLLQWLGGESVRLTGEESAPRRKLRKEEVDGGLGWSEEVMVRMQRMRAKGKSRLQIAKELSIPTSQHHLIARAAPLSAERLFQKDAALERQKEKWGYKKTLAREIRSKRREFWKDNLIPQMTIDLKSRHVLCVVWCIVVYTYPLKRAFQLKPSMNTIKEINRINERELQLGVKGSWHDQYRDSAYIFIGGLAYEMTEGDVIAIFSQWGEVIDINLPRDKETGKQRGFGFLMYEDQKSTVLAVDNMNGAQIAGRIIRVDHCRKYEQKGQKNEQGEYVAPEEPTYNAMPPTIEDSSDSDSDTDSDNQDDLDEEDPMAATIRAERKLAKAEQKRKGKGKGKETEKDKDKKRKRGKDGKEETKEERRARKEEKRMKRAEKERRKAKKDGESGGGRLRVKLEDERDGRGRGADEIDDVGGSGSRSRDRGRYRDDDESPKRDRRTRDDERHGDYRGTSRDGRDIDQDDRRSGRGERERNGNDKKRRGLSDDEEDRSYRRRGTSPRDARDRTRDEERGHGARSRSSRSPDKRERHISRLRDEEEPGRRYDDAPRPKSPKDEGSDRDLIRHRDRDRDRDMDRDKRLADQARSVRRDRSRSRDRDGANGEPRRDHDRYDRR